MKRVPDVAIQNSCLNSCFVTFSCELFSKISSTAILFVFCKGILVKRLQTSNQTNFTCCISSRKINESLVQCSFEITVSRILVRNLARL